MSLLSNSRLITSKEPPGSNGSLDMALRAYLESPAFAKDPMLFAGMAALADHLVSPQINAPRPAKPGKTQTHIDTGKQSHAIWGFTTQNTLVRAFAVTPVGTPVAAVTITGPAGVPIRLDRPTNYESEAQQALDLVKTLGTSAAREIVSQAFAPELVMALDMEIDPYKQPNTVTLWDTALGAGATVLHEAKRLLDVPRPSTVAHGEALVPVPGHASFPSGHAFAAHMLATLLSNVAPADGTRAKRLDELAKRIGANRVSAGLHTESDTNAGRTLGKWFGAQLTSAPVLAAAPEWERLVSEARKEW